VRHIMFSSSNALYLAVAHSLRHHLPSRGRTEDADEPVVFPDIPCTSSFSWRQLSWLFTQHVASDEVFEVLPVEPWAASASSSTRSRHWTMPVRNQPKLIPFNRVIIH
jgi:hypothetical protein